MDQPPRDHLPHCQCHQRESMSEFEPACSTSFAESVCQANDHRICYTADSDFLDAYFSVDFSAKNVCSWQQWSRKQLIQRRKSMERHRQQCGSASDRRSRIRRTMMPLSGSIVHLAILFFTFLCFFTNVLLINAFNIDTTNPVYRVGPSRSQFGFSIAFHFRQEEPM